METNKRYLLKGMTALETLEDLNKQDIDATDWLRYAYRTTFSDIKQEMKIIDVMMTIFYY